MSIAYEYKLGPVCVWAILAQGMRRFTRKKHQDSILSLGAVSKHIVNRCPSVVSNVAESSTALGPGFLMKHASRLITGIDNGKANRASEWASNTMKTLFASDDGSMTSRSSQKKVLFTGTGKQKIGVAVSEQLLTSSSGPGTISSPFV